MTNSNDLKTGLTIKFENNIYSVIEFLHVKPGKGPAFVRTKLKNLKTGATIDKTFNAGIKIETAHIDKQKLQFLYNTGDVYTFMNMETYDQIELNKNVLDGADKFLTENLDVEIISYENEVIGVNLPDKITMKVVNAAVAVKGNTSSGAMKDATLETGYVIKVPLFIEQDEMIIVSSKDGKYSSRA